MLPPSRMPKNTLIEQRPSQKMLSLKAQSGLTNKTLPIMTPRPWTYKELDTLRREFAKRSNAEMAKLIKKKPTGNHPKSQQARTQKRALRDRMDAANAKTSAPVFPDHVQRSPRQMDRSQPADPYQKGTRARHRERARIPAETKGRHTAQSRRRPPTTWRPGRNMVQKRCKA